MGPCLITSVPLNFSWNAVNTATSYTLQEQVNGGSWATIQTSSTTSKALSGKGNGSYGYQVQACNVGGCGPWSSIGTTIVQLPPPVPASITIPATSNGSVPVSWIASNTATSYTLQHANYGITGWSTVYTGSATTYTSHETTTGAWIYQVQACNASGCSAFLVSSGGTSVTIAPASAPTLTVPASSNSGNYTVGWGAVAGATSYPLQEQVNGGAWAIVQSSSATSDAISGKANGSYGYRAQACNAGGCGPWSGTSSVSVLLIPATPTGLSATLYATFYSDTRPPKTVYTLTGSWSGMAGASNYNFQYCQQSGSCYTQNTTTTSIPEFTVQGATASVAVQACNANGCSAWSASVTPTTVNQ